MNEFLLEPKKEKIPIYFHGPQIIVAWILYQQGISIQNSWLIAELFDSDPTCINTSDSSVSELLDHYQLLSAFVMYYDGGGEYRPLKKSKQEQAFYDYFEKFNFIEAEDIELAGDKMILICCNYMDC